MNRNNGRNFGADLAPAATGGGLTNPFSRVGIALWPFSPVSFSDDPLMAWGRIVLFGGAAALCHKHNKTAAYVLAGVAGVCAIASISTGAYAATVNPPTARSNTFVPQQPPSAEPPNTNTDNTTDNAEASGGGYSAGGATGSW